MVQSLQLVNNIYYMSKEKFLLELRIDNYCTTFNFLGSSKFNNNELTNAISSGFSLLTQNQRYK